MMLNFENSEALLDEVHDLQLLEFFVMQLEKDFALANVTIQLLKNHDGKDLVNRLKEKVYFLIMESFDQYLNLLYVIDVPEKEFKTIDGTDAVEVAEQVTFLILKREFQKVWSKKKYS
jgi:hypothetical protein